MPAFMSHRLWQIILCEYRLRSNAVVLLNASLCRAKGRVGRKDSPSSMELPTYPVVVILLTFASDFWERVWMRELLLWRRERENPVV